MNFKFTMKKRKKGADSQRMPPQLATPDVPSGNPSAQKQPRNGSLPPASASHVAVGDKPQESIRPSNKVRSADCEGGNLRVKRQKTISTQAADADAARPEADAKAKRFTLFVGNMPFNVNEGDVQQHFSNCGVLSCRLLRNKDTGVGKGIAFLDFTDSKGFVAALKLNHSLLGGRAINVEPTAGGGGNSTQRMGKIELKKKRLEKAIKGGAGLEKAIKGGAGDKNTRAPNNGTAANRRDSSKQPGHDREQNK
jgi:nucleolar protein 6